MIKRDDIAPGTMFTFTNLRGTNITHLIVAVTLDRIIVLRVCDNVKLGSRHKVYSATPKSLIDTYISLKAQRVQDDNQR